MKLFDDFERTNHQPSTRQETEYDFLNNSARPASRLVREKLNEWFENYPEDHRYEFRSRLKIEFHSPFFELFLHEVFLRLGATVELHPEIGSKGKRPEFLATFLDRIQLTVEATLCTEEDSRTQKRRRRIDQVYDAIDQIDSPDFFVTVTRLREPEGKQIASSRVVAFLNRELALLDPDELVEEYEKNGDIRKLEFTDKSGSIRFQVVPKKPEARNREDSRVVGMTPMIVRRGGSEKNLNRVLSQKGKHYGELNLPFLIAVNTLGKWGVTEEDRISALFGTREEYISATTGELGVRHLENGFWGMPSNPRYTRVSGVLMGIVTPWNLTRTDLCLYFNPWASHPVANLLWPFPTASWTENGIIYKEPKQTLADLLELTDDWPGQLFA